LSLDLHFKSEAGRRLAEATKSHAGKPLAILINNQVVSAPVLDAPLGADVRIRGSFTEKEVSDLAAALEAVAEKNRAQVGILCSWVRWC
jgi:SecD/SecF fusion protein